MSNQPRHAIHMLVSLALSALPAPAAHAQGPAAIADKTVVYEVAYSGGSFTETIYIAPSGHIYSTSTAYRSATGSAPSGGLAGGEYQIGKTIEFDHGLESARCHSRSHATFAGRRLTLSSTSTCSAPLVAPITSSGAITVEFQGSACRISWTPKTTCTPTSCRVVPGTHLMQ